MLNATDFFSDSELLRELFRDCEHVWDGIRNINRCILSRMTANIRDIVRSGPLVTGTATLENGAVVHAGAYLCGDEIELGRCVVVEAGAYIRGPAVIGDGTRVRHGAYIRGNVITGPDCVIGHATEVKNSAMLGGGKAAHFAYIGDSILGAVNLGAGTRLANKKITDSEISVHCHGRSYKTGLKKMGAVMGDGCRTGCNSTTAPGTVMSRNVLLYPHACAGGFYPPGSIIYYRQDIEVRR